MCCHVVRFEYLMLSQSSSDKGPEHQLSRPFIGYPSMSHVSPLLEYKKLKWRLSSFFKGVRSPCQACSHWTRPRRSHLWSELLWLEGDFLSSTFWSNHFLNSRCFISLHLAALGELVFVTAEAIICYPYFHFNPKHLHFCFYRNLVWTALMLSWFSIETNSFMVKFTNDVFWLSCFISV